MDTESFNDSAPGRLVRRVLPSGIPYWAFVPNPLPPSLGFDTELVHTLSEADRALGELAGLGRTMQNPHLLINPFMRREAVLSSRIEGTQANISQIYAHEALQIPFPGIAASSVGPDAREVMNYVDALQYGLTRLVTLPVSLRLIREIHDRLLRGARGAEHTPGEFRLYQNAIGQPGSAPEDARFVPPPPEEMQSALESFERYLHETDGLPPLIRIGLAHYQFEAIHPFADGNGRAGRLLISLLLVHWGLLPSSLLYLSAYFEKHSDAYYDHLLHVSQRGAWREWLIFFLKGVADQSRDAVARAKRLQDLQQRWHQMMTQPGRSILLSRLVDSLFVSPVLTIPQAAAILSVTYRGAELNIDRLVQAGILKHWALVLRPKIFIAEEILGILD